MPSTTALVSQPSPTSSSPSDVQPKPRTDEQEKLLADSDELLDEIDELLDEGMAENPPIRLSDVMRAGANESQQVFRQYMTGTGDTCALGAAWQGAHALGLLGG